MNIQDLLNRTDRFAANAGCRITEMDERHAVAEMTVTAEHLNGGNVCQGGALFTLADLDIKPEAGNKITEAKGLSFKQNGSLIEILATDVSGIQNTAAVAVRSEGGRSDEL